MDTMSRRSFLTQHDARVSGRIAELMFLTRFSLDELAGTLGIPRASFARRLYGQTQWKADEVARLGEFFGGLDADGLPRLDSNQQPSDCWSHAA
ncbi:MAG: BetR domain [Actinomycetota bacterium]|jgi:cyanate lyase